MALATALDGILTWIQSYVVPIGALAVVACGFMWAFSSNPQTVQQAKSWFFRILIGILIIMASKQIVTWAKNIGTGIEIDDIVGG